MVEQIRDTFIKMIEDMVWIKRIGWTLFSVYAILTFTFTCYATTQISFIKENYAKREDVEKIRSEFKEEFREINRKLLIITTSLNNSGLSDEDKSLIKGLDNEIKGLKMYFSAEDLKMRK